MSERIRPDSIEEESNALHDGKPEPEARIHASLRRSDAIKFLKNVGQMDRGDADAGIGNDELHVFATSPTTEEYSAFDGVTQCVRQ